MYAPMLGAIEQFVDDGDVGCIVVTGAGSAFCAGGDVRDGSGRRPDGSPLGRDQRIANLVANSRVSVLLHEAPIVTIAAVNGPAVGAGMAIALACDLRIAAESARFIGGWARLGFSGDFGGPWLLAQRVGASRALDLLVNNVAVDARRALEIGLVDRVVRDADFAAAWMAWAAQFADGPRTAIGYIKDNIGNASRMSLAEAIAIEAEHQVDSSLTDDHRQAVKAWIEKRDPVFRRDET
jgi:2-(1,2-epoxy-1,2-dihydrophenyl)acetyl-CoA isomerase